MGILTNDNSVVDRLIELDPDGGDSLFIDAPGHALLDPAAAGAVAMPTMDLSTVGRTRDEEQAVLEELSGTGPVGARTGAGSWRSRASPR